MKVLGRPLVCILTLFAGLQSVHGQQSTGQLKLQLLQIGDQIITVEVADTIESRRQGLMYRRSLPENQGMLFVFPTQRPLSFWMKNTWIPLSIGFFDSQRKLLNILDMQPESLLVKNPKSYASHGPAQYALEMNKGWFAKNKITPGMTFEWRKSYDRSSSK